MKRMAVLFRCNSGAKPNPVIGVQNVLVLKLIVVTITFLAFTIKDLNDLLYLFFFTILILLLISIEMSGLSLAADVLH